MNMKLLRSIERTKNRILTVRETWNILIRLSGEIRREETFMGFRNPELESANTEALAQGLRLTLDLLEEELEGLMENIRD